MEKPLYMLHGEIKSPPFSVAARKRTGALLWLLQTGDSLPMPHSRPMPAIGKRCHEPRVPDERTTWRVIYRVDPDGVVVLSVFAKKTQKTPQNVIDACQKRLREFDSQS